jgi:HEAT repeat protein
MANRSINQLRSLLDHLDGDDRADQLAFFRSVLETGPDAVIELDSRLPGSRAPLALRRLVMEASFYLPWPGWVGTHRRLLRYEPDFEVFLTGVRALGRVGSAEALDVLRELNTMRQGNEFKESLADVLAASDPREAFSHHLAVLLQGSGNAAAANEAALRLRQVVDAGCIDQLKTVARHPDLLVFRHALTLLGRIQDPAAADALMDILMDSHREVLADRALKDALAAMRGLAPAAAREAAAAGLEALGSGGEASGSSLAAFHRDVLAAAQDAKGNALAGLLTQAAEAMHLRSRRQGFAVDAAAEGLAELAGQGQIEPSVVLDVLVEAFRQQTGREGVARAIARLAPSGSLDLLGLILDAADAAQRVAALEVLGTRSEPGLAPALLKACQDPLTDLADRARQFLGRLPNAEAIAARLLDAANAVDFQLGLRLAAEQRFQALVPRLLELLGNTVREDQSLQVVETLGQVGAPAVAEPLLEMLHSGASPRLQAALVQALRALGTAQAALGLCAKVEPLRNPSFHALALEAVATLQPPPPDAGTLLLDQARRAWNDRNPWALRLRVVQALLPLDLAAPELWKGMAALVDESLGEKRAPGVWSSEDLHLMQGASRDFARRG